MSAARDGRELFRCQKCGDQTLQDQLEGDAVACCGPCFIWFDEKVVLVKCTREARIINQARGAEHTPIDFFPAANRARRLDGHGT